MVKVIFGILLTFDVLVYPRTHLLSICLTMLSTPKKICIYRLFLLPLLLNEGHVVRSFVYGLV